MLLDSEERQHDSPLAALTPREREVLAAMASGKSNAAIAADLVLTKRAVEKHVGAIFLKLGLPERGRDQPPRRRRPAVPVVEPAGAARRAHSRPGVRTPPATPVCAIAGRSPRLQAWPAMVRVLTVDDHPSFRDAARAVITATPGSRPLAEVTSGEDALALLDRLQPELVLLDISLPGIDGLETCRRLTAADPPRSCC